MYETQTGHVGFRDTRHGIHAGVTGSIRDTPGRSHEVQAGGTGFGQNVLGSDRQEVRGLDSMYGIQTGHVGFRDTRDGIQAGGKGFLNLVHTA